MSAEARKYHRLVERSTHYDDWIDCEELMPVAKDTAQHPQQDLLCVCEDAQARQRYAFCISMKAGRWRGGRLAQLPQLEESEFVISKT